MMNRSRFLRGNFEELGLSCSLAHAPPPQSLLLQQGFGEGVVGAGARWSFPFQGRDPEQGSGGDA